MPLSEHRLLRLKIQDMNRQRAKVGAAPITSAANPQPVGTTPRSAQKNAAAQNEVHARQLDTLRQSGQSVDQQTQQGTAPIASDERQQQSPSYVSGTPSKGVTFGQQSLSGDQLKAASQKRRSERLKLMGVDPNSETLKLIDQGGRYAGTENGMGVIVMPDGRRVPVSEYNATTIERLGDSSLDPTNIEKGILDEQRQQGDQEKNALLQKQGENDQAEQDQQPTPLNPNASGAAAALANLPPEASFLAPYLQQFQDTISQSLQENAQLTGDLLNKNKATYDGIDAQLSDMREGYKATTEAMNEILQDVKEQNEENFAQQKKAEEERLAWQEAKLLRDTAKNKRKDQDAMVAQIALMGGFAQDAGIRAVMESDAEYDQKMADLQIEFGLARTDLAAKYSALYAENNNTYAQRTVDNMKELRSALERIGMQGIASQTARMQAEQSILTRGWETQAKLRGELADRNYQYAKEIGDVILSEKQLKMQEKRWAYERQWEEYVFGQEMAFKQYDVQADAEERELRRLEREDALDVKRDDQERYKSEAKAAELTRLMDADNVMVDYNKARMSFDSLEVGFNQWKQTGNAFSDRDMAKSYEKLVEVGSVVMPGEYADITGSAPLFNKIKGKIGQVLNGGQNWTNEEREQLHEIGQSLFDAYKRRYEESSQKFYMQLDFHNRNVRNPAYQLRPSMIGLPERTTSQQRKSLEDLAEPGLFPDNPLRGGGSASLGEVIGSLGRVTQDYHTKLDPKLYGQNTIKAWGGTHKGLDVAVPQGTRLPSFVSGRVVEVGYQGGWGGTVVIEDEAGARHRISHLSGLNPSLKKGAFVKRGQEIGTSGGAKGTKGAGNSTGPHIDYRIQVNGSYVDPMSYHS